MMYNANVMKQKSKKISEHLRRETLGERIARLRKERRYSQTELAEKIGVSQKLISDYEINRLRPPYENIIKLALTFGITTDELIGLKTIKDNGKKPSKKILRRMEKIESLPLSQQKFIIRAIDSHLKAIEK